MTRVSALLPPRQERAWRRGNLANMMKRRLLALSRRYQAALQKHLQDGTGSRAQLARRLGQRAVTLSLETLDLAQIHMAALLGLASPNCSSATRRQRDKRAGAFFTECNTAIEKTHRAGVELAARLNQQNNMLTRRTAQLAAANRHLRLGIIRRKAAEKALKTGERHYAKLLRESRSIQKHLRRVTHGDLSAQENDRRNISRDLRNEIVQTLLGINVKLLTLKRGAATRNEDDAKEIASTQRLLKKSVKMIDRFAREFNVQHEA
jgi:hypothetical protein